MSRFLIACSVVVPMLVVSFGCASHTHLVPTVVDIPLEAGLHFDSGAAVAVRAGTVGEPSGNRVGLMARSTVRVDYAEYTDDLVRVLDDVLHRLGVSVSDGGSRWLDVTVRHVNFAIGGISGISGRYDCFVDVKVTTTEGYVRGFEGTAWSANYAKACNHATARVAQQILLDPDIRRFIEGG